jgi:hypothetical protein
LKAAWNTGLAWKQAAPDSSLLLERMQGVLISGGHTQQQGT